MKKLLYAFVVTSCLLIFSIPAYSGNIVGKWKKVDSYQCIQILNQTTGITIDLRNGNATKFNYQFLSDEMINIENSHSSQVQKINHKKEKLIFTDLNGANSEVFVKYSDESLPGVISNDFQRYLDRTFPGLCRIKSFAKNDAGKYIVRVVILKDKVKAFSTSGTHISALGGGLMKKSPFVWIKPAGKKGSYGPSGMWQSYSPGVAEGDIFQVSFAGYF